MSETDGKARIIVTGPNGEKIALTSEEFNSALHGLSVESHIKDRKPIMAIPPGSSNPRVKELEWQLAEAKDEIDYYQKRVTAQKGKIKRQAVEIERLRRKLINKL